jgi:hypothetical protein
MQREYRNRNVRSPSAHQQTFYSIWGLPAGGAGCSNCRCLHYILYGYYGVMINLRYGAHIVFAIVLVGHSYLVSKSHIRFMLEIQQVVVLDSSHRRL